MIVTYSRFNPSDRERIRKIEQKGHVNYIRYLLLRRTAPDELNKELLRLSLSTVPTEDLWLYFELVLYPVLVRLRLKSFYERYRKKQRVPILTVYAFQQDENMRIQFLSAFKEAGVDYFIVNEAKGYYGVTDLFPIDEKGEVVITTDRIPDWERILNFEKRYIIDGLLIDGKTPDMIFDYFADVYGDDSLDTEAIHFYQMAFFNVTRQDLQKTINLLDEELRDLEERYKDIREHRIEMTLSERSLVMSGIKQKTGHIREQIKRLSSHYSDISFSHGVLEASHLREMFADIAVRTHKRWVALDSRKDDSVIEPLSKVLSMFDKSTNQVKSLDDILVNRSKKTVAEEMLEVLNPALERIEQEQREDMKRYQAVHQRAADERTEPAEEGGDDILGFDD